MANAIRKNGKARRLDFLDWAKLVVVDRSRKEASEKKKRGK